MEFLDFTNGKGALDENFDFDSVLKRVHNSKFMQKAFVNLDDETINRVLKSKKYIIGESIIEDSFVDLNMEFGTLNKDKGYECYYDMCAKNLIFYAVKSEVDGKEIVELCATTTLVNENGGISSSLYYIPKGNFANICMIARVCHHQGTNEHHNSDGTVVGRNDLHIHIQSEEYINFVKTKFGNRPERMLIKLQSPDATILKYPCNNVRQLADIATKEFSITNSILNFIVLDKNQMVSEMSQAFNQMTL